MTLQQASTTRRISPLGAAIAGLVAISGCASLNSQNNHCGAEVPGAGHSPVSHAAAECDECDPHGWHSLLHWYPQHQKVHKQGKLALWWEAKQACHEYCESSPLEHSHEFREGFRRGYADVADGGDGLLPTVPPEKYWSHHYRTPAGQIAAQNWFVGFETGAAVARSQGYPERAWVATSDGFASDPHHPELPPAAHEYEEVAPHGSEAPYHREPYGEPVIRESQPIAPAPGWSPPEVHHPDRHLPPSASPPPAAEPSPWPHAPGREPTSGLPPLYAPRTD